jgi:HAMP domain-containing protein
MLTAYFAVLVAMWLMTFAAQYHITRVEAGSIGWPSGSDAKAYAADSHLSGHFNEKWQFTLMIITGILSIGFFPFCLWSINRLMLLPLKRMIAETRQVAEGRFDRKIHASCADDIGKIAEHINDLLANVQEILLLFWNQTLICSANLNKTQDKVSAKRYEQLMPEIDCLRHSLDDMRSVLEKCCFYDVRVENGKAVAGGIHER